MAKILIQIQRIEQLFDTLVPTPFRSQALGRDVEDYIVDKAENWGRTEPLRIVVRLPADLCAHADEIARAIPAHFDLAHSRCRRQFQQRMRIGRTALVAGFAVLVVSLLLRALLGELGDRTIIIATSEGLLILGWVALWRPLEILLFERLENHQKIATFLHLSLVPVDIEVEDATPVPLEAGEHELETAIHHVK